MQQNKSENAFICHNNNLSEKNWKMNDQFLNHAFF